ncbi:MAG: DUF3096 domain-containing protein [Thermoplasmata archaeon]
MDKGLVPSEVQAFLKRRGISLEVAALLMILFGVLIIAFPGLVALLVGLYLIVAGVVTLVGHLMKPRNPASG